MKYKCISIMKTALFFSPHMFKGCCITSSYKKENSSLYSRKRGGVCLCVSVCVCVCVCVCAGGGAVVAVGRWGAV